MLAAVCSAPTAGCRKDTALGCLLLGETIYLHIESVTFEPKIAIDRQFIKQRSLKLGVPAGKKCPNF